jgi:aminoglycoside phosphotransferase (APT) family kinase protein
VSRDRVHGEELSPEDAQLLRARPPIEALRWCASSIAPDARVVAVSPLAGGTSSAVHAVDVADRRGHAHELVLRRFVRSDWLAEEPGAPRREAAALEAVARAGLPAPRLVAVDADGSEAGAPAILMTRLPGAIDWRPSELDPYLRRLAVMLPVVHSIEPPTAGIPPYEPYALELRPPPAWARRPELWGRAFEIFNGPRPSAERRFIHRDYHPGNVLWREGELSGIVDWVNASLGSPLADVGYCRMNLAGAIGLEAADRLLEFYLAIAGVEEYDPYWDIVAALGGFDEEDLTRADEEFLLRAAAAR